MLGYDVYISKIQDENIKPWDSFLKKENKENLRNVGNVNCISLSWLNDLVKEGKATLHNGDGYPFRYSAEFGALLESLSAIFTDPLKRKWTRSINVSFAQSAGIKKDEAVYLEAWDQS